MLEIPSVGFNRSVDQINVNRVALADWLEASVVFGEEALTRAEVVDTLSETGVVVNQEVGHAVVDEGLSRLAARLASAPTMSTYSLQAGSIEKGRDWADDVGCSFLLFLSLLPLYPRWARDRADYPNQGWLFERVCEAACIRLFDGWEVVRMGWTPAGPVDVPTIVESLSGRLGTTGHPDPGIWAGRSANDAGLDLLCYKPMGDERGALPYYALQCASGAGWTDKLHEPCPATWMKVLDAAFAPSKGLLIPFEVEREEMQQRCLRIGGPLIDRTRILLVGTGSNDWLPAPLVADLQAWLTPRVQSLPFAAAA